MNKILGKNYGPLVGLVDLALLTDIASDQWKKYKERKAQKYNTQVIEEEDPSLKPHQLSDGKERGRC